MKNSVVSLLLIVSLACGTKDKATNSKYSPVITRIEVLEEPPPVDTTTPPTMIDEDLSTAFDCVRGTPEPVLKKGVFSNVNFRLEPDSLTSYETVTLKNGDMLTIKNSGCEYYCLEFSFETSRFYHDTADYKYWYEKSVVLMKEILPGLDAPLDIEKGLYYLEKYADTAKTFVLYNEVDYGESDPRQYLWLERVGVTPAGKYRKNTVAISFCYGPL